MKQKSFLGTMLTAGLLSTSLLGGNAMAAHADIEVESIINGQIVLHTDAQPIDYATGNAIFEAEFGETPLIPHQTDDPGFVTESTPGPFAADTYVNYRTLGTLRYWDGLSWNAADSGTSLHVLGNFFEDSIYTSAGVSGDTTGLIQVAGNDGAIHAHIDFCVEDQGLSGCPDSLSEINNNSPATGAYMIEVSLFGADANGGLLYDDSDAFFIAFNNGLSEEDFEAGIDSLTAVPVPAAVWLFGSGLIGLVGIARRRQSS